MGNLMNSLKQFCIMIFQGAIWFLAFGFGLWFYAHVSLLRTIEITLGLAGLCIAFVIIGMAYSQIRALMIRIMSKIRGIYLYFVQ